MAAQDEETPETEPLLRQRSRSVSHAQATSNPASPTAKYLSWPTFSTISRKYRWVPLLGCLIVFINEAEYFIKQVATMRAIESMYCYEHYLALDSPLASLGKHIPERLCKDTSIQKNLAHTAGLIMFFRMLAAMVGAIPLGWLADRSGRKIVLVLHKVNVACSCAAWLLLYVGFPQVPIWTLYLSGLPGLVGGNFDIGLAMLFASYTDVMPSATERATLFFLTTSMQYLAQTFCPTIGAILMSLDGKGGTPVVNLTVSLALATITAALTIAAFPETVHESRNNKAEHSSPPPQHHPPETPTPPPHSHPSKQSHHPPTTLHATLSHIGLLNTTLLASAMLFSATGIKSIDWFALVQHPVLKLHWTFSQSSHLVTLEGFLLLLHFSLLLPLLSRLATSHLRSPTAAHLAIIGSSAALLTLGSTAMGLSPHAASFIAALALYLLGAGLPTATQAFLVTLLARRHVVRAMAVLSMAAIGGKLLASLLFARLLAWGLDGGVVGLPFFASAALFAGAGACVAVVGVRLGRSGGTAREEDDGAD